jgi:uncharacterized protein YhaN
MRVLELNLRSYGPFTGKVLGFDEATGLHLIVGRNEVGKSTALRALRGALFGIKGDRDTQLYPKDMLRVGLKVRTADGQVLDVERRVRGGAKSLLFADSQKPVPVEEWARVLPVEAAELFEQMFALNYERLLAGGKQLAEFKNEIGQAMLAAAGDLGQTVARIHAMEERADALYSARASSALLRKAITAFQTADKSFRDERYTSVKYKAAAARREDLEEELRRITAERTRRLEGQSRLTRLETAAPHVQRLVEDERALEALSGRVLLVEDFESRYGEAISGLRIQTGRRDDAVDELQRIDTELARVPRNQALAGLVAEIDRCTRMPGGSDGPREDRPKREGALRQLSIQRDGLCAQLGLAFENVPRPTVEQRQRIEALTGGKLVLDAKCAELPGKIAVAERELGQQEETQNGLPPETDTTELAERLAQAKARKQPEVEAQRLRTEWRQMSERLDRDLGALPLWQGTGGALESLRVPLTPSVSEFSECFVRHHSDAQQWEERVIAAATAVEKAEKTLRLLERQKAIPTDAELADARAHRETGWAAVKEQWLEGVKRGPAEQRFLGETAQPLPDAYETAVVAADSVADHLRAEADRVEQKRAALEALADARQQLEDAERGRDDHRQALLQLEAEWTSLWAETGIAPRPPKEMQAWLERRSTLVGQLRDLARLDGQASDAEQEMQRWRESLRALLGEQAECGLDELVVRAEARIKQSAEVHRKHTECASRIHQHKSTLESLRAEQKRNLAALEEWGVSWAESLRELPVSANADPAAVREVLRLMDEVFSTTEQMANYKHWIDTMKADEASFVDAVNRLVATSGKPELATKGPVAAIRELQALARQAQESETVVKGLLTNRQREERKFADAKTAVERLQAELGRLSQEAGVAEASLLPGAIEGKYPPAEPGALLCEPLEAAYAGSLTRPRSLSATTTVAPQYSSFNWSSRWSSCSCLRMYARITASSRPTVDTKYPRAQKC